MAEAGLSTDLLCAPPQYGAGSVLAVTPSDTAPLPPGVRGIWVGGAGDVYIRGIYDTAFVAIASVPAGTLLPIRAGYIGASSTATAIVALLR